ncbi:MAG: hypothetical protein OYH77_01600 [Pseudomonadota bacterium]|nr:hypothetical protein [Pseudomonadota bacterium]
MKRVILFICLAMVSGSALAPPKRAVKNIVGAVLGRAQTIVQELAAKSSSLSDAEKKAVRCSI